MRVILIWLLAITGPGGRHRTVAGIVSLVACLVTTPQAFQAGLGTAPVSAPRSPQRFATIPFRWTPGQIEVQVSVNDAPAVWFVVDTGAEYSVLDREFAGSLGIAGTRRGTRDFARDVALRIGDVLLRDQEVMLLSLDNFRDQRRPIVGLIGYDFFARYVVQIDYAAHTLALYEPADFQEPDGRAVVPLTFVDRLCVVAVDITLQTRTTLSARAIIDTGASQWLILRYPFAESHSLLGAAEKHPPVTTGSADTRTTTFFQLPVQSLSIAGSTFDDVVIHVYSRPTGAGSDTRTDGALGNDTLRNFRVTIDYPHRRMYLERNGRPR